MDNNRVTKATILLDGKQAEAELKVLQNKVDGYTASMNKARKANDKAGFDKQERLYKAAKREMAAYKRTVVDVTAVLNNLNGSSLKQLSATQKKLTAQINVMNRATKEEILLYNQKVASLKLVKTQLTTLRSEMNITSAAAQSNISKMAGAFNKYSMIVLSTIAAVVGLITILRRAVEVANEFESSVANLSALTGMVGSNLDYLKKRALDFAGSTTEAGIRITHSAQNIVDAYTQMGSKRPELLQNKQDLADVTEQAMILAAASKMELVPSTLALATAMNMFNENASQAPRIINTLAAASRAGAANIEWITGAMYKGATAGDMACAKIEEVVAAVETVAPKFKEPSRAGTQLKNVFLNLMMGADKFNPKIVGMSKALDNLAAAELSVMDKRKMFGRRNMVAAESLIELRSEYKRYLSAITDTDVALWQAGINTQTNKARLQTYRVELEKLVIQLGDELVPMLTFTAKAFSKVVRVVLILVQFYKEHRTEILTTISALIAYKTVLMLQAKWTAITAAATTLATTVTRGYGFAVGVLTGKITLATAAQRIWNIVTKAHPIALLAAAVVAAGTAIYLYSQELTAAEKAQKKLNDAIKSEFKSIVDHKVKLQMLLAVAQDYRVSLQERQNALAELRQISPKYLADLTLEELATSKSTDAIELYIKSLEKKARMQAYQDTLVQVEKDLIDLQEQRGENNLTFWQKVTNGMISASDSQFAATLANEQSTDNWNKKEKELLATKALIYKKIGETNAAIFAGNIIPDENTAKILTIRELNNQLSKLQDTRVEIDVLDKAALLANAKEINAVQKQIDLYTKLGIAKKASKAKSFDPTKLGKQDDYELNYEKYKNKTLAGYRQDDLEDLLACHTNELRIRKEFYNNEMVALTGNRKAQKDLTSQFNQEEIALKIEHLQDLKKLLDAQLEDMSMENALLTDEERDSIIAKIDAINLAISGLNLEAADEEEDSKPVSFFSRMLFGEDGDEATISEKIANIGAMAMDAFNSINQIMTNAENREMQAYAKNNDRKRKILDNRLSRGTLSEEKYNKAIEKMDDEMEKKKAKLAYEQAKRAKTSAILSAIINTAVAVTGALGNPVGPAGIVMAAIVGALGAFQIAAIASEPIPQYAHGNYINVIGADDGKTYTAKKGNNRSRLVSTPTYEPGLGLVAEDDPELVFSGADTATILNTPELINAINHTLGIPQFSNGNSTEIIRENNTITETFTDPKMMDMLEQISNYLSKPQPAQLIANEDYMNLHNQTLADYDDFLNRAN